jgi:hypothetical protein
MNATEIKSALISHIKNHYWPRESLSLPYDLLLWLFPDRFESYHHWPYRLYCQPRQHVFYPLQSFLLHHVTLDFSWLLSFNE